MTRKTMFSAGRFVPGSTASVECPHDGSALTDQRTEYRDGRRVFTALCTYCERRVIVDEWRPPRGR